MLTKQSDEQVAEAAAAGDQDAFGELVRRWENRIHRVAYGMLGDAEEARDATQETFLAAYRSLASFRGDARVSTWLHRIAINECITRQRRKMARPERQFADDAIETLAASSSAHEFAPALAVESEQRAAIVRRAVATLAPEFREVIVLKEFQEMTFQQIAETLGIPLSTVKSRLYTALKQLRSKLERLAPEVAHR